MQPLTDGARALVHINQKGAPLSYRFPFQLPPGGRFVPSVDAAGNEDGGVDVAVTTQVGDGLGEATGIIAHIEKPWVRDATGAMFNANYTIEGNTLVLNATDSRNVCGARGCTIVNAQYPLVADPSVKRNCGIVTCSFYMSRKVTKNLKDSLGAGGTMTSLAAAQICARISHPLGVGACAAVVAIVGIRAAYHIVAAANRKGCFVVRINMLKWAAGGPAAALGFDNVPASNKYCYAS